MSDRPQPMLTLSRRIAAGVGRVPPFGYGLAFLVMIPLYALAYWVISPDEFHHETVAYEEPFYRLVADLEQQFRAVLLEDIRLAYGGDTVVLDNAEALCLDRLEVTGFAIDELAVVTFRLLAPLGDATRLTDGRCVSEAINSVSVLEAAADLGPWFGPGAEATDADVSPPAWLPVTFTTAESYAAAARVFPAPVRDDRFRVRADSVQYEFAIPASLATQLDAAVNVYQGSAEGSPGEFVRMLYFSASAATTTGYGDIVPLTTRARVLTASEVIVGMILVGLFLNSLTGRQRRDGGVS